MGGEYQLRGYQKTSNNAINGVTRKEMEGKAHPENDPER